MTDDVTLHEKLHALYRVATFRPLFAAGIIVFSLFTAILEGVGLSFLLPVIELARDENAAETADGLFGTFAALYETIGVPFVMEYVITGVALVMTARYVSSFLVDWLRSTLRQDYVRFLQTESFGKALDARVMYFDRQGSDEILNAIVTQAEHAGRVISLFVKFTKECLISVVYVSIAIYLSPGLTISSALVLGTTVYLFRSIVESGYTVGDRIAQGHEQMQTIAQAGMQGIRDVKVFGMATELDDDFQRTVDDVVQSKIRLFRNQSALDNFYQLATALIVIVLIYVALTFTSLSLAGLGVFLFAMFRLAPRVSGLNNLLYKLEGDLPHLVRTQEFIDELGTRREHRTETEPVPDTVEEVTFDGVSFTYDDSETVLTDLSLSIEKGEFVAFVGPSGAGKSTIASLLSRLYEPDEGVIEADETPVEQFDVDDWRTHISFVRQNPFIFNDTLRRNITIGNRNASQDDIERAAEIASVTEFLDELPAGYRTVLGDDGIKLSGGQKQRVALARALLKDADFLILDEATSDLDLNIEENVRASIESMEHDYGMVVIAHRLSTVVNADRIYTLKDGEVTEFGTHDELVERHGTYADLYRTQTRER